ncbi:MAG TPA: ABC transporter ATP-binding protein [Aliidongia sp.]|nr:ABC transporter ATP-binding protein [Aliidongia sp.]
MLIEVEHLTVSFPAESGWRDVVRDVSFSVGKERLGIVGESGSGKSLTARALLRLLPTGHRWSAERLRFEDIDLLRADEAALTRLRGRRVGLVLQDPRFSLNPVMTAGQQIAETWRTHKGGSRRDARSAAIDLLRQMRIGDPERVADAYPHELSGGLGQRVMIAMMLAPDPDLLIADEPTSALDAAVQVEILRLLDDLVARRGMGLVLISHDLPMVSRHCDRIIVMRAGQIVEEVPAGGLAEARHPYTRGLLRCLPSLLHPRARLPSLRDTSGWPAS